MDEGVQAHDNVIHTDRSKSARIARRFSALRGSSLFRSKRVLLTIAIVATIVIAAGVGMSLYNGPSDDGQSREGRLDIGSLEDFENTVSGTLQLGEQDIYDMRLEFFHLLELPSEFGEIVVCFIDHVSVSLRWMDEPDEQRLLITWENQPDTFSGAINDYRETFNLQDEASNVHGQEGELFIEWSGEGTYMEETWRRLSEHEWEGLDGVEYVDVKGGDVVWDDHIEGMVILVECGDHTHDVIPRSFQDTGNSVDIEITMGGKYHSMMPGEYEDPPEEPLG